MTTTYETAEPQPALATRPPENGPLKVQCPVCGNYEMPFAITKLSAAAAALAGHDWACGGCISRWDRQPDGSWASYSYADIADD